MQRREFVAAGGLAAVGAIIPDLGTQVKERALAGGNFINLNVANHASIGNLDVAGAASVNGPFLIRQAATVLDLTVASAATMGHLNTENDVFVGGSLTVISDFQHVGPLVGFYGAMLTTKPTVTGAVGGNAALASLINGLAQLGLITNNTTF